MVKTRGGKTSARSHKNPRNGETKGDEKKKKKVHFKDEVHEQSDNESEHESESESNSQKCEETELPPKNKEESERVKRNVKKGKGSSCKRKLVMKEVLESEKVNDDEDKELSEDGSKFETSSEYNDSKKSNESESTSSESPPKKVNKMELKQEESKGDVGKVNKGKITFIVKKISKAENVNEADDDDDDVDEIHMTDGQAFYTRCRSKQLHSLIQNFTSQQLESVREIGFGGLLQLHLIRTETSMLPYLIENFDHGSWIQNVRDGMEYVITPFDVYDVFALPMNPGKDVMESKRVTKKKSAKGKKKGEVRRKRERRCERQVEEEVWSWLARSNSSEITKKEACFID